MQTMINAEEAVESLLVEIGEDPSREGLQKTPHRVVKALRELTEGYTQDLNTVVNDALYVVESNDPVLVRNLPFYSLCEHHLLPFFGSCDIAYVPNGRIIGLSKLGRILDIFARRLQVQEVLTAQIADAIIEVLEPQGVMVRCRAEHFCQTMRGVRKAGAQMETCVIRGSLPETLLK